MTLVSHSRTWMAALDAVGQRYYSYRLVYYRPSTSYLVEPTAEGSIKSASLFLRTNQSTFGARFHG